MAENFDSIPAFDLTHLEREYADAPDVLDEIFGIFSEETPSRLSMLEEGLSEDDSARVQKAAHSLANTCGTLMAERALTRARATEAAARENDIDLMREHGRMLARDVRDILEQIEARQRGGAD